MEEKTFTVLIGPNVQDTYFNFPQQTMSEIVDALHKHDKVVLKLTEGVALEEINYKEKRFLDILKDLCLQNSWPLDKIHFVLPNLIQDKTVWPSIEHGGSSLLNKHDLKKNIFLGLQAESIDIKKDIHKHFGLFINRSQWDRLLISSHMFKNHRDITMQTFRKDLNNSEHMIEMGLDLLYWKLSSFGKLDPTVVRQVSELICNLPLTNGTDWKLSKRDDHQQTTVDESIMVWYNNIFLDIVCEKMVTGKTFFPTEKVSRPLATKTPFLVMASPNYITNLHRLGFKSFSQFWNESYDYQQGVQRIESIKNIIDSLARLPINELQNMYEEMEPILEHNQKHFMSLTPEMIVSAFE